MATAPQSKRGKPLQKFDLELVEKLAARGLSYKQLAIALGMTLKPLKSTVHSILCFKKQSTEVGFKD
jgi:hypothetical protein